MSTDDTCPCRHSPSSSVPRLGRTRSPFAHRGGASDVPENTMPAFEYAVDLGYRYLETDVQVTSDGVLAAFHDNDLRRTCGRSRQDQRDAVVGGVDGAWSTARRRSRCSRTCSARGPSRASTSTARPMPPIDALVASLRRTKSLRRVCVAAFSDSRLRKLRDALGGELCSVARAGRLALLRFGLGRHPAGTGRAGAGETVAADRGRTVRFVERAHRLGIAGARVDDRRRRRRWTGCSTSASTAS